MPEALTVLSEEESQFQTTVRRFAKERLAPHVRTMDDSGVFRKDLLQELFDLGLMAIDVPEDYGGQGGSFFQAILAIEELAKVDPSASVIVDVHNTLFNNAICTWGTDEQRRRILPRAATNALASYALSEAGSGSDAFALSTRATEDGDALPSPAANCGSPTRPSPPSSSSSPPSIPTPATRASRRF